MTDPQWQSTGDHADQAAPQWQSTGDHAQGAQDPGFFSTLGTGIASAAKGLYNIPGEIAAGRAVSDLTAMGESLTQGRKDAWQQAKDAYAAGNYKEAAEHAIGAFPVVGPPFNAAMNTARMPAPGAAPDATHQGMTGAGLAQGVIAAAPYVAPELGSQIGKVTGPVMDATADFLRRKSLSGGFSTITPSADVTAAIGTMKDADIPMSAGGASKIQAALDDLQQRKLALVTGQAQGGGVIDPAAVDSRALDSARKAAVQVNPKEDIAQIQAVRKNFLAEHTQTTPGTPATPASTILGPNGQPMIPAVPATPATSSVMPIPTDLAESLKEGTYSKVYDPSPGKAATVVAEQSLARGLKEEIETQIPEMGALNAAQAKQINLQGILEKAVTKYTNSGGFVGNLLKNTASVAGATVGGAAGAASHNPVYGASAAVMQAVLADPLVQSQIARAIDMVRRVDPTMGASGYGVALSRVAGYRNSLTPPAPQPQPAVQTAQQQ